MTDALVHPPQAQAHLVESLSTKYADRVPRQTIEAVVASVWTEISTGARFDTYLPVLARRLTEERLRQSL